jgi:hypothetical protein
VEPDVFICFKEFDLIIEAKRWDEKMQSRSQWENELQGYANEHGELRKPVRLIALGGIRSTDDDQIEAQWSNPAKGGKSIVIQCPVHMCRWQSLLSECRRMERELKRASYPSSQTHANQRILLTVISIFEAHSFLLGTWFCEMVPRLPQIANNIGSHVSKLHSCRHSSLFPSL